MGAETLKLGPYEFTSRLFVGTGKYETFPLMAEALAASGCQVVTVAVRRVNLDEKGKESLLDYVDPAKYTILPSNGSSSRCWPTSRRCCPTRSKR